MRKEILEEASARAGIPYEKLHRAVYGPPSFFDRFTKEKEKNIAFLKLAMGEIIREDNLVLLGFAVHLLPKSISHVLRVGLTAEQSFRVSNALESKRFESEDDALQAIEAHDQQALRWVQAMRGCPPWETSLYDIKLPVHKTPVDEAVSLICQNAGKEIVKTNSLSQQALEDFILASRVKAALVEKGHFDTDVESHEGGITVVIKKHVIRLGHLENELKEIASGISGVKSVKTKIGPDFYKADIYRRQDFEVPKRVLLVDDEQEYVQTLSERLQMREFGTAVALNGEEALSIVRKDEPEVIVLDLRMPGIDGIEVLRRLKRERPHIEVIILTGHGTERDREISMELGAFAYLEKPVDVDKLSDTMKAAYEKIRKKKDREGGTEV
jgi:CheY-like chemotaxis protein